ncbi:MAG: tRNA(Ile)-lysidine synthetase, partial [Deltaproteobacteria bacterium]|nr:tRNA(Ile)-lysidine synthetase [Deltaproteobacteria bacterium]
MSDEEETRLVREIAASLDLPFETEKADCLDKDESSVEERARDARYGFLERVLKRHQAQKIATGHNLDDQAETVLMRLL